MSETPETNSVDAQPLEVRKLADAGERVETGAIQFGEDWPGVFIRGDNAFFFARSLDALLANPNDAIARAMVQGLRSTLTCADLTGISRTPAPPVATAAATGPEPWTLERATQVAHAAGFAGDSWMMGAEELAHLLDVATGVVQSATPDVESTTQSRPRAPLAIAADQKSLTFEQHTALHGSRADVLVRQVMVHLGYLRGDSASRRSEVVDKVRACVEELEVLAQRTNLGALPVSVDDLVEAWHQAGAGTLPEFLGLTGEQYARWVTDPDSVVVPGPLTAQCVLDAWAQTCRQSHESEEARLVHFGQGIVALTVRRLCETPTPEQSAAEKGSA